MPEPDAETMTAPSDSHPLRAAGMKDLLIEVARRLRVRFGKVEISFHDGQPAARVIVEHRIHQPL